MNADYEWESKIKSLWCPQIILKVSKPCRTQAYVSLITVELQNCSSWVFITLKLNIPSLQPLISQQAPWAMHTLNRNQSHKSRISKPIGCDWKSYQSKIFDPLSFHPHPFLWFWTAGPACRFHISGWASICLCHCNVLSSQMIANIARYCMCTFSLSGIMQSLVFVKAVGKECEFLVSQR